MMGIPSVIREWIKGESSLERLAMVLFLITIIHVIALNVMVFLQGAIPVLTVVSDILTIIVGIIISYVIRNP